MKRFLTAFILLGIGIDSIQAQNSPLGGLPPVPNLETSSASGDKSLGEKIKARRKAANEAQRAERIAREDAARKRKSTGRDMIRKRSDGTAAAAEEPARAMRNPDAVPGQFTAPPDAMTPSGSRLKPFGSDDFWQEEEIPEENIIDLPPLPDLRTPQQKTWLERQQEARVAKFEARHEAIVAKEEAKEKAQKAAAIRRTPPDPSTALVKVERQMPLYGYNGAPINPETPNGSKLKAFNQKSTYVRDNQLVFTGARPERPQTRWIKRGLNPGAFPGDGGSKMEWRNPFAPDRRGSTDYEITPLEGAAGLQGNAASEMMDDGTPLVSSLRGIRVVPGTRDVSESGLASINGIVSEGVDLPDKAYAVLSSYLGQGLTLGSLNKLVRDTVVAYRESDLPVIDVLVPEQEVTSGVLQLVIIEGRVGDVLVEGVEGNTATLLANNVRLERGEVIRESVLMDDLNWMNKHPFRRVDLVYSPGADYGTTDVILRAEQMDRFAAYLGYEDSGNEVLGRDRFIAGASLAGPLFFSEENILSYQFTTNLESESELLGHSAIFASYLPWRHYFTLLGAYVESEATIDVDGAELKTGGLNQQLSARYAIPLPSLGKWTHEFEVGMDFKSSNSDLAFNSLEVFDTTSEIVQFTVGYNSTVRDTSGQWKLDTELVISPGDMTSKATDEVYEQQRALASSDYIYGRVVAERQQALPKQWQLIGRVQGQASGSNLLPSETLGAGGYDSVRGFEQRIARGDNGFVGTLELRTPPVSPARLLGFYNANDALVFLTFIDYANLVSSEKLPDEESVTLGSVGAGFRYQLDDNVSVRLDYGTQVVEEGFDDGEQGRFHVGARANF